MINPMRQLADGGWVGPGSADRNRIEQEQREAAYTVYRRWVELEEMRARGLSTYEPMLATLAARNDPFRQTPELGGEWREAYMRRKEG